MVSSWVSVCCVSLSGMAAMRTWPLGTVSASTRKPAPLPVESARKVTLLPCAGVGRGSGSTGVGRSSSPYLNWMALSTLPALSRSWP